MMSKQLGEGDIIKIDKKQNEDQENDQGGCCQEKGILIFEKNECICILL